MSGVQIFDLMSGYDDVATTPYMWNYSNHGTVQHLSNNNNVFLFQFLYL